MEKLLQPAPPRRGTGSLKWDTCAPDVLPFWVADMDFQIPEVVQEALAERLSHPVFGYGVEDPDILPSICQWYKDGHNLEVTPEDLLLAPGVMPSLSLILRVLTQPGDRILVLTPAYRPFFDLVTYQGRELDTFALTQESRTWTFDAELLEEFLSAALAEGKGIKALLFCSPHNPVGRVWRTGELQEISRLVHKYNLLVFSDEIHQDLVFPPHRHQVLAGFDQNLQERTVVVTGGGKTFNLAGLPLSHILTFNKEFKKLLTRGLDGEFFHHPNVLAQVAAKAAFQGGRPWLEELLELVQENYQHLCRALPLGMVEGLPAPLEGTYLAWVDFSPLIRKLGLSGDGELSELLVEKAGVRFSPGSWFGGPPGYLRINLACPWSQLEEGLKRLTQV